MITEERVGIIFSIILWVWGVYLLSRYTYLIWFDYPNVWSKMVFYREEPEWFRSAPAELLYKLVFPAFWILWVILIPLAIYQGVINP